MVNFLVPSVKRDGLLTARTVPPVWSARLEPSPRTLDKQRVCHAQWGVSLLKTTHNSVLFVPKAGLLTGPGSPTVLIVPLVGRQRTSGPETVRFARLEPSPSFVGSLHAPAADVALKLRLLTAQLAVHAVRDSLPRIKDSQSATHALPASTVVMKGRLDAMHARKDATLMVKDLSIAWTVAQAAQLTLLDLSIVHCVRLGGSATVQGSKTVLIVTKAALTPF